VIRAVDQKIATGVWPDMTEHGWEYDDWPAIHEMDFPRFGGHGFIRRAHSRLVQ
jgi:hypothetical protein